MISDELRKTNSDRLIKAWFKSVVLQVALWSAPYVRGEDF
jgi:hypothetical protein